jgi:hypothetical protein
MSIASASCKITKNIKEFLGRTFLLYYTDRIENLKIKGTDTHRQNKISYVSYQKLRGDTQTDNKVIS